MAYRLEKVGCVLIQGLARGILGVITRRPLYRTVVRALIRDVLVHEKSLKFRRDVVGAIRALEFESRELAHVQRFPNYPALLAATLGRVDPKLTEWVELGTGTGASTREIAAMASRLGLTFDIHGFDSFEGLPEDWNVLWRKGDFASPQPKFKEPNIYVHKGWFHETLPGYVSNLNRQIGFIHVDCDLYSSTRTALDILAPHIGGGTVLLFDEWWNYVEFEQHVIKAFKEVAVTNGFNWEYIGYNENHMQASVVIR